MASNLPHTENSITHTAPYKTTKTVLHCVEGYVWVAANQVYSSEVLPEPDAIKLLTALLVGRLLVLCEWHGWDTSTFRL